MVFSMQSLTRSAEIALAKGPEDQFSRADLEAVRPIARSRPEKEIEADDKFIRQILATLASATRSRELDLFGGTLKLAAYRNALRGASVERLTYAYQALRDRSEFFPSIPEWKAALREYKTPEQKAVEKARWILECGKREKPKAAPLTQEEIDALSPEHIRMGLILGEIIEIDGGYAPAPIDTSSGAKKGDE